MRPHADTSRHRGDSHALELVPFRTLLSEIQLEERLGSGAGGTTWKCRWRTTTVAIKLMVSTSVDELRATTREAVCSRACSHPHVVQCYAINITQITEQDLEQLPSAATPPAPAHRVTSTQPLVCLGTSPTIALGLASYRQQHLQAQPQQQQAQQHRLKRQTGEPGTGSAGHMPGAVRPEWQTQSVQPEQREQQGQSGRGPTDAGEGAEGEEKRGSEHVGDGLQFQPERPSILGYGSCKRAPVTPAVCTVGFAAESPPRGRLAGTAGTDRGECPPYVGGCNTGSPSVDIHPRGRALSPPMHVPGRCSRSPGAGSNCVSGGLRATSPRSTAHLLVAAADACCSSGTALPPPVPALPLSVPPVNVGPTNAVTAAAAAASAAAPPGELSSHRPSSVAWWGEASESLLLDGDPGDQAAALREELIRLGAAPGKFLTTIIMEWCDGGTLYDEFTIQGPPQPPLLRRAGVMPGAHLPRSTTSWDPRHSGMGSVGYGHGQGCAEGPTPSTSTAPAGMVPRFGTACVVAPGAAATAAAALPHGGHSTNLPDPHGGGGSYFSASYFLPNDLSTGTCAALPASPHPLHTQSRTSVPTTTTAMTVATTPTATATVMATTPSSPLPPFLAGAGGGGGTSHVMPCRLANVTATAVARATPFSSLPMAGPTCPRLLQAGSPDVYDFSSVPGVRGSANGSSIGGATTVGGGAGGGSLGGAQQPGNSGRLPVLLRCALEVAQGMSYLHSLNLAHGDLTPKNVLLKSTATSRRGYNCKISDFGLSNPTTTGDCLPVDTSRWGTLVYMAPEIFTGRGTLKQADVYSFGALLWHMATGRPPHQELRPAQVLVGLATGELRLVWPDWVDPAVVRIGKACMDPDPAARPQFEEVVHMLLGEIAARSRSARRRGGQGKRTSATGGQAGLNVGGPLPSGAGGCCEGEPGAGPSPGGPGGEGGPGGWSSVQLAGARLRSYGGGGGYAVSGAGNGYGSCGGGGYDLSPPLYIQQQQQQEQHQQQYSPWGLQANLRGQVRAEPWQFQRQYCQPHLKQHQHHHQQQHQRDLRTVSTAARCCEWQPVELPLPATTSPAVAGKAGVLTCVDGATEARGSPPTAVPTPRVVSSLAVAMRRAAEVEGWQPPQLVPRQPWQLPQPLPSDGPKAEAGVLLSGGEAGVAAALPNGTSALMPTMAVAFGPASVEIADARTGAVAAAAATGEAAAAGGLQASSSS